MQSLWSERLEAAREALAHTRSVLKFKSANKVRKKDVQLSADAYGPARTKYSTVKQLRDNLPRLLSMRRTPVGKQFDKSFTSGNLNLAELAGYAAAVQNIGIGNCTEHAVIAFDYLFNLGWRELEIAGYLESDHVFVLLGSARPSGTYFPASGLPLGAVVCDPWANIVCPAWMLRHQWANKMAKWEGQKKKIVVDPEGNGEIISALDFLLSGPLLVCCSTSSIGKNQRAF